MAQVQTAEQAETLVDKLASGHRPRGPSSSRGGSAPATVESLFSAFVQNSSRMAVVRSGVASAEAVLSAQIFFREVLPSAVRGLAREANPLEQFISFLTVTRGNGRAGTYRFSVATMLTMFM